MSYSADLLSQARVLVKREPRKPRQASLRRAISTSYYAVFHHLTEDAASQMLPGTAVDALRAVFRRAFDHGDLKQAAKSFAAGTLPSTLVPALGGASLSPDVRLVARVVVDLQEARHEADYDFSRTFTRRESLDLVEMADMDIRAWHRVRRTPEGKLFLVALLVQRRLSRL